MIPTLLGIVLIVLLFTIITPGDPVKMMMGERATPEQIEAMREELGLNDPLPVRYVRYIRDILHGDFGRSYFTSRPVFDEISQRFPYTLMLECISLLLSVGVGVPLGIYAATNHSSWKDNVAIFASLFCVSMPAFWFALLLIQWLSVNLRVLPISGIEDWKGWILPAVTGALGYAAVIARQMRSNLLEVIRQDYITTARAKGQSEGKILYRHALKNAVIPVIMLVGWIFGMSMGGSMIAEIIFSIPGLGSYTLSALQSRNYPVIQSSVLLLSAFFAVVLLTIDIIFAIIDPRIRVQYAGRRRKAEKGAAQ